MRSQKNGLAKGGFFSNLRYDAKKNPMLLAMMIPSVAFFLVFNYLPMVGIYYAFTDYNVRKGLFGSRFVGLNNFKFLFSSGAAWTFTANTLLYNIIFIVIGTALRIAFAIMLAEMSAKFFKKTCQTLMFLPHFVSMVLVGTICFALFNSNGFINSLRLTLGMDKFYYYETPWVWYILIPIVNFWKTTGYGTVVYLSAITGISDDLYEAADLDGATFWQEIIHITLPCLRPTIVILFLMSLGNIMRGQFDLFYQLVGNVPLVRNTTEIIDTYVFRAATETFDISRYGGGLVPVRGGSAAGAGLQRAGAQGGAGYGAVLRKEAGHYGNAQKIQSGLPGVQPGLHGAGRAVRAAVPASLPAFADRFLYG